MSHTARISTGRMIVDVDLDNGTFDCLLFSCCIVALLLSSPKIAATSTLDLKTVCRRQAGLHWKSFLETSIVLVWRFDPNPFRQRYPQWFPLSFPVVVDNLSCWFLPLGEGAIFWNEETVAVFSASSSSLSSASFNSCSWFSINSTIVRFSRHGVQIQQAHINQDDEIQGVGVTLCPAGLCAVIFRGSCTCARRTDAFNKRAGRGRRVTSPGC
jgi:hypothetical protein